MNKRYKNKRGFTLMEMIFYVSLTSLIVLSMSSFFQLIQQIKVKNQAISVVEEQGTFVANKINETIRNARNNISTMIICTPESLTPSDELYLDTDGNCGNNTADQIKFSVDSGTGIISITQGADTYDLTDVRVLVGYADNSSNYFEYGGGDSVDYSFKLSAKSYGSTWEYQYSKDFSGAATIRIP